MKIKSSLNRYIVLLIVACSVIPICFCSPDVASGSEVGNPRVVTGIIADSSGSGVGGVNLFLIDSMETDPLKLVPDSCYRAISDTDGVYNFQEVYKGSYTLYGYDSSGKRMFLTAVEIVSRGTDDSSDTLEVEPDTLETPATVVVSMTDCHDGSGVLFIPGTVIQAHVDSCGNYVLKCPPSPVTLLLYRNDSVSVVKSDLLLLPDQWVDLTNTRNQIPTPEIISGIITGINGRMYSVVAGQITLRSNVPVQYRFDWIDTVSTWSFSNQATHAWTEPGLYQIRVQARNFGDTLSVSAWSEPFGIRIQ